MTISTWFDTDTFEGGLCGKKRASSRKEKKTHALLKGPYLVLVIE
jgi:hypothetical protein